MDFLKMIFFSFFKGYLANKIDFISEHSGNVLVGVKEVIVLDEMETDFSCKLHVLKDFLFEVDGEDFVFGDDFKDLNDLFS